MKKNFFLFVLFLSFFQLVAQNNLESPVKWEFKTEKINDSVAELQFVATIKDQWHLYSQYHTGMEIPLSFEFVTSHNYKKIGKVLEPKPKVAYEPSLFDAAAVDTILYFDKKVTLKQKIQVFTNEPFDVKGELSGQACIDGRCVAIDQSFAFSVSGFEMLSVHDGIVEDEEEMVEDEAEPRLNMHHNAQHENAEDSLLLFFVLAILGGMAGLLMPCVFPMIPMTISYFLKIQKKAYALFFGTSIVIIFLLLGILLSVIFGPDFANIVSTHWIPNILFATIFVVFALSLFGYFEITLPSSWVNKSAKMESTGGLIGVFFMALTLVLVSFSCTLPIAGAVALNSVDGSFLKPIIGMLGFSLGIAVPFTLFAFFPRMLKTMPKSGGWMNTLKVMLAFIELAFALKFFNVPDQTYGWRILDREIYLAFWIVIFAMMGFYLLGKIRFPHDDEMPVQKSWIRLTLAIFTFSFVVYLIPGMFGAPLKAISGWLPPMTTQDFDVSKIVREEVASFATASKETDEWEKPRYADKLHLPHGIFGYFDLDQALNVAKKIHRPVFIDFTGHGCVNCRNVESAVWEDPRIRTKFAQDFVVVAQYVDDKVIKLTPEDKIIDNNGDPITMLGKKAMFYEHNRYKENSQPVYFIVDVDGSVLAGPIYYELNVENYLMFLDEGIRMFKEKHGM